MSKEIFEQRYFTQAEAESKVGKRVQTRVPFSGVPKGHTGSVISADFAGLSRIQEITRPVFDVVIQWDSERKAHGEISITSQLQKPLVDWFTKEEYERYLDELHERDENPSSK